MRKVYIKPELHLQTVQLGVFGNYEGGEDRPIPDPRPFRVGSRFDLSMD